MSLEMQLAKDRVRARGGVTARGFTVAAPPPTLPKPAPTPSLPRVGIPAGEGFIGPPAIEIVEREFRGGPEG